MGINICVFDERGRDHPGWDFVRRPGDLDFTAWTEDLPREFLDQHNGDFRPVDFPAWRARVAEREWPNPKRFERLLDILEGNPKLRLHYSR